MSPSSHQARPRDNERPWMHGVAGVAGGSIAMMMFYPLDFLRTRMHMRQGNCATCIAPLRSAREIVHQEGLKGMYKGMTVSVVSHSLGWGTYLLTFRSAQRYFSAMLEDNTASASKDFASACVAATITGTLITPLHVLKTRRQLHDTAARASGGGSGRLGQIARTEGFRALFRGVGAQIVLTGNTTVQVTIYESLRRRLCENGGEPSAWQIAAASGVSKAVACTIFNPLEVVRTRLQAKQGIKHSGTAAALQALWREEGVRGLYRGLPVNIARVVPSTMMAFVLYEKCLAAMCAGSGAVDALRNTTRMRERRASQPAAEPLSHAL